MENVESQAALKKQIQCYNFAAYDLLLYLDTHPKDKNAFLMFKDFVEKTKSLISDYESNYGPLTAYNSGFGESFNWLNSPWPWEKEANK